ncbi:hypothetical protein GGR50DRAFT_256034 [Xylaria sp. CBS 124048]|nr:hypothetical protein GGR50DRAFT_256034 [Xylaria sp. CBS 124048]
MHRLGRITCLFQTTLPFVNLLPIESIESTSQPVNQSISQSINHKGSKVTGPSSPPRLNCLRVPRCASTYTERTTWLDKFGTFTMRYLSHMIQARETGRAGRQGSPVLSCTLHTVERTGISKSTARPADQPASRPTTRRQTCRFSLNPIAVLCSWFTACYLHGSRPSRYL